MPVETAEKELKAKKVNESNIFDFRWEYSPEEICCKDNSGDKEFLRSNFSFDPARHEFEKIKFSF